MDKLENHDSFLISDPRNDFESRENDIIKEIFGLTAGNIKLEIAIGNLISHYRAEHKKLIDLTYEVVDTEHP